jgi:hypothetical protein
MAERNSEYTRMEGDDYATPAWVTEALLSVESFQGPVWEPAAGDGHMVKALIAGVYSVIPGYTDFLLEAEPCVGMKAIVTNPPYKDNLHEKFVRHALDLVRPNNGKVAMLLPLEFDSAKRRVDIFRDCSAFKAKHTLMKRIRWENLEQKAAGPSKNHAWYVWDWDRRGPATMGWLP